MEEGRAGSDVNDSSSGVQKEDLAVSGKRQVFSQDWDRAEPALTAAIYRDRMFLCIRHINEKLVTFG